MSSFTVGVISLLLSTGLQHNTFQYCASGGSQRMQVWPLPRLCCDEFSLCQWKQDKTRWSGSQSWRRRKEKAADTCCYCQVHSLLIKPGYFEQHILYTTPSLALHWRGQLCFFFRSLIFMQDCWFAAVREPKHTVYYFWQIEAFVCLEHFQAFNGLEALWHVGRRLELSVAERWWCQRLALPARSAEMHPGGPFMPDWHRYPSSGLSDFKWQCCECPTAVHYVKKWPLVQIVK